MGLQHTDLHFLKMAQMQGEKSQFSRKKRGAVLAKNNKVLSVGVSSHLNEAVGAAALSKLSDDERYVATVNAEIMAIGSAIKNGLDITGSTIYISDCPNWAVFKFIVIMGIKRIAFYGPVSSERVTHYSQELGVEIISVG